MGQKVNSLGMRLGINRTWSSKGYEFTKKLYSNWLIEDSQIRDYLTNIFKKKNILTGHIQINRSKGKIFISFPVFFLSDFNINQNAFKDQSLQLSESELFWNNFSMKQVDISFLEKKINRWISKSVHIDLKYVKSYFYDSILLAQYVALQLENRVPVRNALKVCLEDSRKDSDIRGIRIHCGGRLDGVEMAKNVWIKDGQVPLHTLHASIDYGTASAYTIYGVCGIKAWICFHPRRN